MNIALIVMATFLIVSFIFVIAALVAYHAYDVSKACIIAGTLTGFRKEVTTYDDSNPRPGDASRYDIDSAENGIDFLPVFSYTIDGESFERTTISQCREFTQSDIGKTFELLCVNKKKIVVNSETSLLINKTLQMRITSGLLLIAIIMLVPIVIFFVAKLLLTH